MSAHRRWPILAKDFGSAKVWKSSGWRRTRNLVRIGLPNIFADQAAMVIIQPDHLDECRVEIHGVLVSLQTPFSQAR